MKSKTLQQTENPFTIISFLRKLKQELNSETELKSLRAGCANLKDSYAKIIKDEVILIKCHI